MIMIMSIVSAFVITFFGVPTWTQATYGFMFVLTIMIMIVMSLVGTKPKNRKRTIAFFTVFEVRSLK